MIMNVIEDSSYGWGLQHQLHLIYPYRILYVGLIPSNEEQSALVNGR